MRRTLRRATRLAAPAFTTIGALSSAHLLLLLGAALWSRGRRSAAPGEEIALAVVIPAHDEETQIAGAVDSIRASAYAEGKFRVVVVADNCTDRTAAVAAAAGAEVWERADPDRRGKGYALAWAFERLLQDDSIEGVAVIDADCAASANLLATLGGRLQGGADAVQAGYLISNPEASPRAALRWAGSALFNIVRPLGRTQLGLSSGLLGTGMALSRQLLLSSPWEAFSYAEDREQHMRWVLDGARVAFAPEAHVSAPAPSHHADGRAQEARWESGRAALAADLTPKLLARWLRTRELAALDAALEPVLAPQSLLLGTNLLALAASSVAGRRILRRLAAASLLGQCTYIVGGLAVLEAPAAVWRALLSVPWFLGQRLSLLAGAAVGRGPSEWERTRRPPAPAHPRPVAA
jgi:cellulose synthase/poly-beta-1,6-N-acetylglucosamine synthase-like glycosyltransferase